MTGRLIGQGVLAALGLYVSAAAWDLGVWEIGEPGAGLFPLIFGATLALLGSLAVARSVLVANAKPAARSGAENDGACAIPYRLAVYLAALVAYAALFEVLGFVVSTAFVFMAILVLAERMLLWKSIAITIVAIVASYLLFTTFLSVPFPAGILR